MRTAIFNEFATLTDDFRKDWGNLWALSPDQRRKLVEGAMELDRARTKGETKAIIERTVAGVEGEQAALLRTLSLLKFLCSKWNAAVDTPERFLGDVKDLCLLPEGNEAEAEAFLLEFFSRLQEETSRRMTRAYATALLPSFLGVTTLVDMRPVFSAPFGAGPDDSIEGYSPNLIGWVPVVLLHLKRDSGVPETWEFQCEEQDIRIIIDSLRASLRDLEEAKKRFPDWEDEQ